MNRQEKLKKRLFEVEYFSKKEWFGDDETILTSEEICNEPVIIRKAIATAHVLKNMPIEVKDDELIVGIAAMASIGLGKAFPKFTTEKDEEGIRGGFTPKTTFSHPIDFEKLLTKGISGIQEEIYERMDEELALDTPDPKKMDLFRAMIISTDGLVYLAKRYAQLVSKCAAEEADPQRRRELVKMARICSRVPRLPAETFQEALQSFWFAYISFQSTMEIMPAARSDQYLYPFYKRDIENGIITPEEGDDLVCSWLLKFSERVQLNKDHWESHIQVKDRVNALDLGSEDESYNYGTSVNHWQTNMILAGQTREGEDATNELTYSILRMYEFLEPVAPVLSVRFHDHSPEKLYDACSSILRKGAGGIPAIYNDKVIIEALVKAGIPIEDARDYSNDGCWEVLIPGKSDLRYPHLELLQILEYMLQHGDSLVRNRKEFEDIGDLEQFDDFEAFYRALVDMIEKQMRTNIENELANYHDRVKISPVPLVSAMMNDCIKKGRDKTDNGVIYAFYSVMVTGLSNFMDSLLAIRQFVYEEKLLTLTEMADMCKNNFEGNEVMRQRIIHKASKVGNDIKEADDLMVRCLDDIQAIMMGFKDEYDTSELVLCAGIGTFENFALFGHGIGATPDGRLSQDPISSNYSPSFGMDQNGPTAAVKSFTRTDLTKYMTGSPIDLQFNSNEVAGDQGIKRINGMIRSFCDLGGNIMTLTGCDDEMLKDAKVHPEKHKTLRVRLGGYSAYFTQLSEVVQDSYIERTKHSL